MSIKCPWCDKPVQKVPWTRNLKRGEKTLQFVGEIWECQTCPAFEDEGLFRFADCEMMREQDRKMNEAWQKVYGEPYLKKDKRKK